jgi:hypothetical protein
MSQEPMFIHVYNALTGEETQRKMTDEETAEYEARIANSPTLPSPE